MRCDSSLKRLGSGNGVRDLAIRLCHSPYLTHAASITKLVSAFVTA